MVSPAGRRGPRSDRGGRGPGPGRGGNRSADSSGGGGERRGRRGGRGGDRERTPREDDSGGFSERVVHTRRIAKVVKGGRRLRFNALVVIGDGQGRVGAGMGKALAIPDAVRKGTAVARRGTVAIPMKGSTIPHEISVRKGASIVVIKPAPLGTGIIAAGAMRAMLELGGVQDVVGKSLGSRNPINIVQATLEALRQLRDPEAERARRLGTGASEASVAGTTTTGSTSTAAPAAAPTSTPPPARTPVPPRTPAPPAPARTAPEPTPATAAPAVSETAATPVANTASEPAGNAGGNRDDAAGSEGNATAGAPA